MSTSNASQQIVRQLQASQQYFNRSTSALGDADSGFRPSEGMMTAVNQVSHAGMVIDWFLDGVQKPEGFDLDFEAGAKREAAVTSLTQARAIMDAAYKRAIEYAGSLSEEQLAALLPPGPIMGGQPLSDVFWGLVDHTAHHRGALTAYARALGKVPPMPYMK